MQQAYLAMAAMAQQQGDAALAKAAKTKAEETSAEINSHFYDTANRFYAFSRNNDGSLDHTATIYPAVAWWDGTTALPEAMPMLCRWASSEFSTDWGARDISREHVRFTTPSVITKVQCGLLFTGWVSLAEYRAGKPLAGYASLMQNLNLDLGARSRLRHRVALGRIFPAARQKQFASAMVLGHGDQSAACAVLFGLGLGRRYKRDHRESTSPR